MKRPFSPTGWSLAWAATCLLSSACAGGAAEAPSPEAAPGPETAAPPDAEVISIVDQFPEELQQSFRQELEPKPIRNVVSDDGTVKLRIEATEKTAIEPVEHDENAHVVVSVLAGYPFVCWIYGDQYDPAYTLDSVIQLFADERADWYGVDQTGAGVVEGRPYLRAVAILRKQQGERQIVGNIHAAVGSAQGDTAACAWSAPGRRQAFTRIFEGVLGSLETPLTGLPETLAYHAIGVTTTPGGGLASFSEDLVFSDEKGRLVHEHWSSRVIRASDLHLATNDGFETTSSENGKVVSGTFVSAKEGELDYNLELRAVDAPPSKYHVEGELMDKGFSADFAVAGGLNDVQTDTRALAALMTRPPGTSIAFSGFEPELDPTKPVGVTIDRRAPTPGEPFNVVVRLGDLEFPAEVNERGDLISARMNIGGAVANIRQLWLRGTLVP